MTSQDDPGAEDEGGQGRRPSPSASGRRPPEPRERGTSSKPSHEKPANPGTKVDDDEEYPDHCGDLVTFIEGRQVIEWVSPIISRQGKQPQWCLTRLTTNALSVQEAIGCSSRCCSFVLRDFVPSGHPHLQWHRPCAWLIRAEARYRGACDQHCLLAMHTSVLF